MKIYTGTGDQGKTSLFSGERVSKADRRLEACGDVDELNSVLGALAASLNDKDPKLTREILEIQSTLFLVGAFFVTTRGSRLEASLKPVEEEQIKDLENAIDRMDAVLPPLAGFILPAGHDSAARAHIARTVCRRAERHAVSLLGEDAEEKRPVAHQRLLVYLNRLSDYLFMLSRYCNRIMGVQEIPWKR
ncbi:MAG: cob(I)yrinic acid a,c-diamide adenosyltransferase [Deltaproteobacteria bacterium]